eukprot:gene7752-932_t
MNLCPLRLRSQSQFPTTFPSTANSKPPPVCHYCQHETPSSPPPPADNEDADNEKPSSPPPPAVNEDSDFALEPYRYDGKKDFGQRKRLLDRKLNMYPEYESIWLDSISYDAPAHQSVCEYPITSHLHESGDPSTMTQSTNLKCINLIYACLSPAIRDAGTTVTDVASQLIRHLRATHSPETETSCTCITAGNYVENYTSRSFDII